VLRKEKLHRILRRSFLDQASSQQQNLWRVLQMKWETPAYNDMRFGFEVTMYIYNR
jgi:pyrroloquinoline quinone biosynthesis protein A